MPQFNHPIPAEERAARYRRRLKTLAESVVAWSQRPGPVSVSRMLDEARTSLIQLETEERMGYADELDTDDPAGNVAWEHLK